MDNTLDAFTINIENATLGNSNYRQVLYTGKQQLVLMCLKPGEEIGMEVHETIDQFFRVEKGQAKFIVNGKEYTIGPSQVLIVPAGAQHNVINSASEDLKLYTIYAPAQHPAGTLQMTKPAND